MYGCEFVPSSDADRIRQSIQRRGISQVWHLTRLSQLQNIFKKGALLSRKQMDELGILYGMSGWGNDAKAEELKEHICCSIIFPWGMSQEEPETKALVPLDPRVLLRKGVLFCGIWSSFNVVTLSDLLKNCTVEAFDLMFDNETTSFPTPPPGEFLVPHCIPVNEFIPRINVYSDDTKQEAYRSCGDVILPSGDTVKDTFQFNVSNYCFRGSI